LEQLVKAMPADALAASFPQAHLPLLTYVQRQHARRQRPASAKGVAAEEEDEENDEKGDAEMEDAQGGPKNKKSWDAFQEGDDKEALDKDGDDDMGDSRAGKKRARASKDVEPRASPVMAHEAMQSLLDAWEAESDEEGANSSRKGKRKRGEVGASSTWIHEDANVPLDFMSADAAHSVLTTRPPQRKRIRAEAEGPAGAENRADALRRHGLRFADDGRLVVDDTVEEGKGSDEDDDDEGKQGKFNVGVAGKEPKALSKLAELRAKKLQNKAKMRIERKGHLVKGLDEYKPGKTKAAGDAKRKGKSLNPFAYVRLNPKVTKEKFRKDSMDSFSKVIKGAKKGVLKGNKAKARDAKNKVHAQVQKKRIRKGKPRPTMLR